MTDRSHATPPGSFVLGLLASPVAPVYAIRRDWRTMGLGQAYLVHVLGVVLWLVLFSLYEAVWSSTQGFGGDPWIVDLLEEFQRADREELLLMLLGIVLLAIVFESGWLVLAWVLMPWGASPEPWRRSMGRSLTRVYQLAPFLAVSLVVLIAVGNGLDEAGSSRYSSRGYTRATLSWEMEQLLFALLWLAYLFSQVGVLLWAVAIHSQRPGWAAACPWPAECEGCGYQLLGIERGRGCPECGTPVADSFDTPRCRPDRRTVLQKMTQATLRPRAFGRSISLYRPATGHRKALAVTAALYALTPPVGMALAWIVIAIGEGEMATSFLDDSDDLIQMLGVLVMIFAFTLPLHILLGLFCATIWGAYARLFRKRNALYPAAQAFGYQSAFLAFWALGAYPVTAIVVQVMESYYQQSYYQPGYTYVAPPVWVELLPLLVVAYHALMLATAFTLQGRLLRGARYGNG